MFLKYLVVASLLLIGCAAAQDATVMESRRYYGPPPRVDPNLVLQLDARCFSASGEMTDLREFLFLRNTTLEPSMGFSTHRITIEDERVILTEISSDDEINHVIRVDRLVSPDENADVELTFALFHSRLYVHWRETFRHQRYRQGLLQLNGDRLDGFCTGMSGIDTTDN